MNVFFKRVIRISYGYYNLSIGVFIYLGLVKELVTSTFQRKHIGLLALKWLLQIDLNPSLRLVTY